VFSELMLLLMLLAAVGNVVLRRLSARCPTIMTWPESK